MRQAHQTGSDEAARVPEIDGSRCVLNAVVAASCRACADACPRSAVHLTDESLGIETEACDGCALCVPACPQAAIRVSRTEPIISSNDPEVAFAACELAVLDGGKGVMRCVHSIGLDEAARLHRRGVRRLVMSLGDCAACRRTTPCTVAIAFSDLGRLLADRGLPELALEELPPARWARMRDEHRAPSRRGFLMGIRARLAEPVGEPDAVAAPAALVLAPGNTRSEPLHPFLPTIDATRCTACDSCSRVCPQGAIALRSGEGGGEAYTIEPAHCTGCGLCADLCEVAAVTVGRWQRGAGQRLRLDAQQCSACGNMFRSVAGPAPAARLCRICATANHNRNLFQVLE